MKRPHLISKIAKQNWFWIKICFRWLNYRISGQHLHAESVKVTNAAPLSPGFISITWQVTGCLYVWVGEYLIESKAKGVRLRTENFLQPISIKFVGAKYRIEKLLAPTQGPVESLKTQTFLPLACVPLPQVSPSSFVPKMSLQVGPTKQLSIRRANNLTIQVHQLRNININIDPYAT